MDPPHGHKAGTTPLRLELTRGTKPVLITTREGGVAQVVPDHDQLIDLTPK